MALPQETILAAQKAQLETLFGLTNKAFEGVEKLVELNLAAGRAVLNETSANVQALLSVKDAQELMALHTNLLQPIADKTLAYGRQVYDIAQNTGTEFSKAFEVQAGEAQRNFNQLVESSAKNAPAGTETSVAVFKSAVSAANNAFESVQKAVKQASDMAEANFQAVANSTTGAVRAAARKR